MIRISALKGYLLEEILAYLIQNTGFRLLVSKEQDEWELDSRGNGLVVKGRGGVHQADVLGQLMWIPAFTFPIRLFVEAKCTTRKTSISIIRNAVGVVNDINQNYAPIREGSDRLIKRYSYHYAVFSTAGFSADAIDFAMAHQISLIDLSTSDFEDLRTLVDQLGSRLFEVMSILNDQEQLSPDLVKQLRIYIRRTLDTWPEGIPEPEFGSDNVSTLRDSFPDLFEIFNNDLLDGVAGIGEIFVGMGSGPFLLTLKPGNTQQFLAYLENHPSHRVIITWRRSDGGGRRWTVRPVENPQAYSVTFGLPKSLGDWIFSDASGAQGRALDAKSNFLKEIMIYRYTDGRDNLYRLTYDPVATRNRINQ